jgi:hypothetical protein
MPRPQNYLDGEARDAAAAWLTAHQLPTSGDTMPEMIDRHYPGGLHFFIAEHLVSPPENCAPESAGEDDAELAQPTLF